MLKLEMPLRSPGLFITGTDTGVGKTVVSCAIAAGLRARLGQDQVGVCKPFGSGCRHTREGLVHEDAEALAHFADCRAALDVINPVRFAAPLAPAVAAEEQLRAGGPGVDWAGLSHALGRLDTTHRVMLVEGVGGVMVPLDPRNAQLTVLDFARALGYPVLVVARSVLGTLNHTAMTVALLRQAGCRVAGVVMNGYDADVATMADPSVASNRQWIERMTGVPVLAVVPRVEEAEVDVARGKLSPDVLAAVNTVDWLGVLDAAR